MAAPEFIAYIDESGDDGMSKLRKPNQGGGASHWLVVSSCVVRAVNDRSLVQYRDNILEVINRKNRDLHFSKLNHQQKVATCRQLQLLPIKLINVLWCKPHTDNPASFKTKHTLYWYLSRYLVERISWLCDDHGTDTKLCKLVFSNRGGMRYSDFRQYLDRLKDANTQIRWHTLDTNLIEAKQHSKLAGLQFADCAAKAFADAVEPSPYGEYEPRYATMLKQITYARQKRHWSYGLKLIAKNERLTDDQKEFLRQFRN